MEGHDFIQNDPEIGVPAPDLAADTLLGVYCNGRLAGTGVDRERWQRVADYANEHTAHWKAEAERLRSLLELAGTRIWEHHEIGHIRRAAENITGSCEACKDDLFSKIEAELRRTGGTRK